MDISKGRINQRRQRRSWLTPFLSIIARFYIYFSIYQYFWTCPSDRSDPRAICQAGDRANDFLSPYIAPYYDQYLAPYVEQAEPYIGQAKQYADLANERYITPAGQYALVQYDKYGKPRYEEAKEKTMKEYKRVVAPKVDEYFTKGKGYYNDYLADHVATGQDLYVQYRPIIEHYIQTAYAIIIERGYPYYIASLPYLEKAWEKTSETAGWVGLEGKGWVERRWGMHVEPQLWRIQERLGRKITHESGATPVKNAEATPSQTSNPNSSAESTAAPKKMTEDIRAEIEADLDGWTAKFAAAGEKAASDVKIKLDDLCEKTMKEQSTVSDEKLKRLNEAVVTEFQGFKNGIQALVEGTDDTNDQKQKDLALLLQKANVNVQAAADIVNRHAEDFLTDVYDKTASIVDDTLEVLDSVHDVGMQDLGMKWAWMEGVTYKDWARYHDLKKSFGTIKQTVIKAGQGHKGLREVTDYSKSIEEAAKKVTKVANDELLVIKRMGKRKIDDSGNPDELNEPVIVTKDGVISAVEEALPTGSSHVEDMENVHIDNKGQVVEENPQSEATDLPRDGDDDEEYDEDDEGASPVDEIGDIEIDNKGNVVGQKQSEADNLKN